MPQLNVAEKNQASLAWLLGAGLEYRITPHWGVFVAPTVFGNKGQTGFYLNSGVYFKL